MAFEERETAYSVTLGDGVAADGEAWADLPGSFVLGRLFREGHLFDFFQAVWLFEQAFPENSGPGESLDLVREHVRFRPHHGLGFPPTDIKKIEWLDREARVARVTLTFMGLYGVDSPLPVYFYDAITADSEETQPLRDFLDIFNHRIYAFFYRAWKKYRPPFSRRADQADFHARVFKSLSGLGTPGVVRPEVVPLGRLVALAGQLASRSRNAVGLGHLVSDMLDELPVRVEENVPRWVPLRERPLMGGKGSQAARLGETAVVGQRVLDLSGKFRLVLGPLGLALYRALLPGGPQAAVVDYLVRLYAPDYLDYDVELLLRTSEVPPVRLGGPQRMGLDMWVGRPAGEVVSVVVAYD